MEQFPELSLRLIPASVVLPLRWSIDELWSAIEDGAAWTSPEPCIRSVIVWRRDLRVFHRTLDADEAELVSLLETSSSLAGVSARLCELSGLVGEAPEQRMVDLLGRWLDAGILRSSASER